MARRTAVLAIALIVAFTVACGGGGKDTTSTPTPASTAIEPTATVSNGPVPTARFTGDPALDGVIKAIRTGDRETIRGLIQFTTYYCTTHPNTQPSYPPLCPTGVPDGSPIQRFPSGSCEFAPISPEGIDYLIDQLAGKSVYGIYASASGGRYASDTRLAVIFRQGVAEFDVGVVSISDGRIVSYTNDCGPRTPQEWPQSLGLGDPITSE
jgi:hypothetical protein